MGILLTDDFVLLPVFDGRTKQTLNALLAYAPHAFILNKAKAKLTKRVTFPLDAVT